MAEERESPSFLTQSFKLMPAIVVDNKDEAKEKRGRVKVRGIDGKNHSMEKLAWGYPISGNLGTAGVGSTSHPYKPGSWVLCITDSTDQQTYHILGAIHSKGKDDEGGGGGGGGGGQQDKYYEPPYSGEPQQSGGGGGGGQGNFHKKRLHKFETGDPGPDSGTGPEAGGYKKNPESEWKADKDMIQWAWDGVSAIKARLVKAKTIAPNGDDQGEGEDVIELIKKHDPEMAAMAKLSEKLMKNTKKDPTKNLDQLKGG